MTDDKFILMGLDDENSKHMAEVLKSKTSKKILDFLADVKEASEKDIADGLEMPINTVEYNLKKLIKSGLVDKTKNFFWSVKGKKIPMYKLAKKHIVIGYKKPNINYIKSLLPIILVAAIAVFALVAISMLNEQPDGPNIPGLSLIDGELKQFTSQAEMEDFVKESMGESSRYSYGGAMKSGEDMAVAESAAVDSAGDGAEDFSTTNIQVEGVDEADIIKNDGKYIYVVTGNKIVIIDAYPADDMEILSEIEFDNNVNEIFINDDKLIVFTNSYGGYYGIAEESVAIRRDVDSYSGYKSVVYIYDISDKENPELDNTVESDSNYIDSRMIGDYVYVISTKSVNTGNPEPPIFVSDGIEEKVSASEVYYMPSPSSYYTFTNIMAIDIDDGDFNTATYLTDSSRTLYVSQDNIYLTHTKRFDYSTYAEDMAEDVYLPILPSSYDDKIESVLDSDDEYWEKMNEIQKIVREYSETLDGSEMSDFAEEFSEKLEDFSIKIIKEMEKTVIHKINIDKMNIVYEAKGQVPGRILDQFSMDEYKGDLRIATTTSGVSSNTGSLNHLYILDEDLEIIGSVENLAEGETIYSARFMGKRAYIVTFKKIDPLFVIDLSDPKNPEVLGYLKITGYSDYLHPYDENHVIGIGKETIGSQTGNFAWYQGVKVSLFDVSDVENPTEVAKIEIGDRGTNSDALYNHKAVLFDREKNLLVLPIELYEIDESDYDGEKILDRAYGEFVWQGAFVLDISLDGISERGRISHDENSMSNEGYRSSNYQTRIQRSLYMGNTLYTMSNSIVKANDLDDLDEINFVKIGYEDDYPIYYGDDGLEI